MADRLLVPALGDRAAHRAPHRLGDLVGIATPRLRQRLRTPPRSRRGRCRPSTGRRHRSPECRSARFPDRPPARPSRSAPARPRRRRQSSAAGAPPRCALRHRSGAHRPCRAVRTVPRRRSAAGPGASRTRSPLRQTSTCGTPASRASLACSARCSASPCAGMRIFGRTQLDHVEQLGAPRMPGDVHQVVAIGDDLDALRDQTVDDAGHRLLVAGDGAGGKDHAVAAASASLPDARPRRCARAPPAARPGCRCKAPGPCRAANSRNSRAARKSCTPSR